jgi:GDPmannose 4,6-dehydratase
MKKTAIVTGILGQDGPYLGKLLLEHGYKVYGLLKRSSNPNFDNLKYLGIHNDIEYVIGDITDDCSVNNIVKQIKPTEMYNLAAQSFVGVSWDMNKHTTEVNSIGTLNLLNSIKSNSSTTRYYQAGTSEMFGNSVTNFQNENTPFRPRSPYGVSKLYAYWMTVNFRESYGIHASNGILFNHESPIRGVEFVTRKITKAVAEIKLGTRKTIKLGSLDVKRDWGFAGDYVEGMWLMLQQDTPDDYVLATGTHNTIRDILDISFAEIGITDWAEYVELDPMFNRPAELFSLLGDASKAKAKLNWEPKMKFNTLITTMVREDIRRLS